MVEPIEDCLQDAANTTADKPQTAPKASPAISGGPDTVIARSGLAAPAAPSRTGLGLLPPFISVIELAAMMLAILLIDWVWPSLDIHNIQPSPYWLPVLMLSVQYGTISGALAVMAAIAFYFVCATFPEQGVGENEFTYRLRILSQPILWIGAALLLGQFRMVQLAAKRELTSAVVDLDAQRTTLADYAQRLRTRCDLLEREIAGLPLQYGHGLIEALGALEAATQAPNRFVPAPTIEAAVRDILRAAYPGARLSLFARDGNGNGLRKIASSEASTGLQQIPADHPLATAIIQRGAALTVLDAGSDASLTGQGVAAVPVIRAASHTVPGTTVIGMLLIEQASAAAITPALPHQLAALARMLAPALDLAATQPSASEAAAAQPSSPPASPASHLHPAGVSS